MLAALITQFLSTAEVPNPRHEGTNGQPQNTGETKLEESLIFCLPPYKNVIILLLKFLMSNVQTCKVSCSTLIFG